jgi:hypothetical protein
MEAAKSATRVCICGNRFERRPDRFSAKCPECNNRRVRDWKRRRKLGQLGPTTNCTICKRPLRRGVRSRSHFMCRWLLAFRKKQEALQRRIRGHREKAEMRAQLRAEFVTKEAHLLNIEPSEVEKLFPVGISRIGGRK